jgi:competence protein ComEC
MGFLLGNTALVGLAVACFLVWRIVLTQPDGYLHVYFLDIGQGDGIFIQTPSGRQVLVDGGIESGRLFNQLSAVMPFWDRSIDLVVLSHPDADHMGAQLALAERYQIAQTVVSEVTVEHRDGRPWLAAMAGAPVAVQWQGGWLDLGDGVALWTLWPWDAEQMRRTAVPDDDKNEQSLVMKLVYGDFSVLLTGDAGVAVERLLVRQNAPITAQVLKAGHHGSRSSTSPDFVEAVNPLVSVIQVGENRYGHPHPDVLEALGGRLILRNDEHGRIHVWSDGRQMWIEGERGVDLGR